MYIAWRGLLFVTNGWAVQSLSVVTTIVPTLLFFVYILALGTGRGVKIIHMTEPSKDLKKIEGAAPNGVAVVNCNDFVIRR